MTDSAVQKNTQEITPVIIDLGKASRKKTKQLKKGEGPLADQVALAIDQAKERLGDAAANGVLPVIVLFEKKRKKKAIFPLL